MSPSSSWNSNDLYRSAVTDCHGNGPVADLLISSSVDQQVKLVNDGCAQPYRSPATAALPNNANWRDELFGVTSEPVVMVYNRTLVPAGEAPASRFDLLDLLRREGQRYSGRVATYDIEASGVGYLFAFLDSATGDDVRRADRGLWADERGCDLLLGGDRRWGGERAISHRLQHARLVCPCPGGGGSEPCRGGAFRLHPHAVPRRHDPKGCSQSLRRWPPHRLPPVRRRPARIGRYEIDCRC